MRAIPGRPESAETVDVTEPQPRPDEYLVEAVYAGLCGTDRELMERTPPAERPLILGHESLGRVTQTPAGGQIRAGTLVVGVIRDACERRCVACRAGRFDQCRSTPLVERGLHGADGFGCDWWVAREDRLVVVPEALGRHGVLVEPLSSLVKGRERLRTVRETLPVVGSERLLVVGAGPIGLLAAWLFGKDFAHTVVIDPTPADAALSAVAELPGVELTTDWLTVAPASCDAIVECSGSPDGLSRAIDALLPGGVIVIEGLATDSQAPLPPSALRELVLKDVTACATVNATREQYAAAATELLAAPPSFLSALITDEIAPQDWPLWLSDARRGLKTIVRFRGDVADPLDR